MYHFLGIIALPVLIEIFYFLSKSKSDSSNPEADAKRFAPLLVSEIKLYFDDVLINMLASSDVSKLGTGIRTCFK